MSTSSPIWRRGKGTLTYAALAAAPATWLRSPPSTRVGVHGDAFDLYQNEGIIAEPAGAPVGRRSRHRASGSVRA